MKNHVMLDIETLGTTPGSVVLSVAAVAFDPYGKIEFQDDEGLLICDEPYFYEVIDLAWWQKQEDVVRWEPLGHTKPGKYLSFVLSDLSRFVRQQAMDEGSDEVYVWSHGAAFDVPLLEACYRAAGLTPAWKFRNVRDTRTVIDLCKPNLARDGLPSHHPLWDAVHQVRQMQTSLGWIAEATGQTVRLDSTRQQ